jgi:hypothetical protein
MNDPNGGPGVCIAEPYNGCCCTNICGPTHGPCDNLGCNGQNGVFERLFNVEMIAFKYMMVDA